MSKIALYTSGFAKNFKCLSADCWDNCCHSWTVDVTPDEYTKYKNHAPELLDSIEPNPYRPNDLRMKLVGEQKKCINLDSCGLCQIHAKYGEAMLPDICNYFPQLYKQLNGQFFLDFALSCPKSAWLKLFATPGDWQIRQEKMEVKKRNQPLNFLTPFGNITHDGAFNVYHKFIDLTLNAATPQHALGLLLYAAKELSSVAKNKWKISVNPILLIAKNNYQHLDINQKDPEWFVKTIFLTSKMLDKDKKFENLIRDQLDEVCNNHTTALDAITKWNHKANIYDAVLKNFLCAKLAEVLFPLGCFFNNPYDEILLIANEFYVILLALTCQNYLLTDSVVISQQRIVELVQCIDKEFYAKKKETIMEHCKKAGIQV
jgi:Putative zinc- or iron-chelating domain